MFLVKIIQYESVKIYDLGVENLANNLYIQFLKH